MGICANNLVKIKLSQLDCHCLPHRTIVPNVNKYAQSAHNQDHGKHKEIHYRREELLCLADETRTNIVLHKIPAEICRNIQNLGLTRQGKKGGKRLVTHLDMVRPLKSNKENLIQIHGDDKLTKPDKSINFSLLNARSIKSKDCQLHHHLHSNKIDFAVIMETWLSNGDTDKIWLESMDLNKLDYHFYSSPR